MPSACESPRYRVSWRMIIAHEIPRFAAIDGFLFNIDHTTQIFRAKPRLDEHPKCQTSSVREVDVPITVAIHCSCTSVRRPSVVKLRWWERPRLFHLWGFPTQIVRQRALVRGMCRHHAVISMSEASFLSEARLLLRTLHIYGLTSNLPPRS